jgi:hypothetical protein
MWAAGPKVPQTDYAEGSSSPFGTAFQNDIGEVVPSPRGNGAAGNESRRPYVQNSALPGRPSIASLGPRESCEVM